MQYGIRTYNHIVTIDKRLSGRYDIRVQIDGRYYTWYAFKKGNGWTIETNAVGWDYELADHYSDVWSVFTAIDSLVRDVHRDIFAEEGMPETGWTL